MAPAIDHIAIPPTPVVEDEDRGIVASRAQLLAWAETARPGDRMVYARRGHLPANSDGAKAARELYERHLVRLHVKPSDLHPGESVYIAQRTSVPFLPPAAPAPRATLVAPPSHDTGDHVAADAILPHLIRAARFGRPCPTNRQIAQRADLVTGSGQPDVDRVQAGIEALIHAHVIRVTAVSAPTLRRVLILDGGAQTGFAK